MFFLWGKKRGEDTLGDGHFDCPEYRCRQPGLLIRHYEYRHVYFVPVSSEEGPEYLRRTVCPGVFPNNYQYDFGPHQQTPEWECF